ncbi:MAG: symmetrical bis(5'-nucleosyl)-tetraphosphatase [Gammaproteobacteria bacterium]|nr:symmetrical bis(5'-nucleosyl)-tetraphosphatase [Gammaproteobacteria bacterium]
MATYAVGDIQGCYSEFLTLLDRIQFAPATDRLWLTGDLVNRGPQSLEVLRFVKDLGESATTVLGNHDLHLLSVAHAHNNKVRSNPTLDGVLAAPDSQALLDWLRHLPLIHHDALLGFTLIHAGLPPQWDLTLARQCAVEVTSALRGADYPVYLDNMYGNQPDCWSEELSGWDRLRFITNCFTRLRFCDKVGRLALEEKGPPVDGTSALIPWFEITGRRSQDLQIIFGHWSTLHLADKHYESQGVHPLDTGCVWGGQLTAVRLDDLQYFSVPCKARAQTSD